MREWPPGVKLASSEPHQEDSQLSLKPIGWVSNGIKELPQHNWKQVESEIVINPELTEALAGLEDFSHIIVVFWMHKISAMHHLPAKVHPRGRCELPLVGLFSTRAPYRPNPIGVTSVRLLQRRGNVLRVKGLDAINGTPVLDIKPYFPNDAIAPVEAPDWVAKLR